jgi:hypothetical protein
MALWTINNHRSWPGLWGLSFGCRLRSVQQCVMINTHVYTLSLTYVVYDVHSSRWSQPLPRVDSGINPNSWLCFPRRWKLDKKSFTTTPIDLLMSVPWQRTSFYLRMKFQRNTACSEVCIISSGTCSSDTERANIMKSSSTQNPQLHQSCWKHWCRIQIFCSFVVYYAQQKQVWNKEKQVNHHPTLFSAQRLMLCCQYIAVIRWLMWGCCTVVAYLWKSSDTTVNPSWPESISRMTSSYFASAIISVTLEGCAWGRTQTSTPSIWNRTKLSVF